MQRLDVPIKKTNYDGRGAALASFRKHRRSWNPVASYHLVRYAHGACPYDRFFSAMWLVKHRVPPSGDPSHLRPRELFH